MPQISKPENLIVVANETNYFQHDYNARNDIKARRLLRSHGAIGYGVFWVLVEMMHEDEQSGIKIDEALIEVLAGDLKIDEQELRQIIDDSVRYGLFFEQDGIYTSDRVLRNKDRREQIKNERSRAGKAGAKARWQNGNTMANAINPMANATNSMAFANGKMANDGKVKESKGKERKDIIKNKQKVFYDSLVPHVEQYGREMIRAFYDHWYQPNKSMTKIRWELEKAWDLEARLRYWAGNDRRFSKKEQPQEVITSATDELKKLHNGSH